MCPNIDHQHHKNQYLGNLSETRLMASCATQAKRISSYKPLSNSSSSCSHNNIRYLSLITLFTSTLVLTILFQQVASSSASTSTSDDNDLRLQQQLQQIQQSNQQLQYNFDASNYKNVYDAIRGHPELREFATLCEADGVRQIVSMDKMPLTVFAPIDRSLSDLLAKAKSRSINLIELTKHHIAQGLIVPDENSQYPLKFATYSLLSPLYLNQVLQPTVGGGNKQQQQQQQLFVNNARILATHLIRIDADTYQTLHVLDHVLEYAYLNRRTQLRQQQSSSSRDSSASSLPSMMMMMNNAQPSLNKRSAFSLDDVFSSPEAVQEFHERFADLTANQASVDQYHTQSFKGDVNHHQLLHNSQQSAPNRITLPSESFNFDKLARSIRQHPTLRGKLFQVNESSSLNTYFLPVNSDELDSLLKSSESSLPLTLEALVIPDQVLFTRTLSLGIPHQTLFARNPISGHRVQLSLAKSLPEQVIDEQQSDVSDEVLSRRFLSSPLLVQAECRALPGASPDGFRSGVTSSELLVANIPLTNGVLHLIRKPLLVADQVSVMDYLNDSENQLSNVVNAIGSRTTCSASPNYPQLAYRPVKVNRFRELLAREHQMLASLNKVTNADNRTILAPSDEAFAKLRFDLRALVQGDEALIPSHWDSSYRRDLLERLVKRHLNLNQTITTDLLDQPEQQQQQQQQILSLNGRPLSFSSSAGTGTGASSYYLVESDGSRARLLHHDLIGSNGVVHIIDRVLGEELETVHSLLTAHLLRYRHALEEIGQINSPTVDLSQLIQRSLSEQQQQQLDSQQISSSQQQQQPNEQQQQQVVHSMVANGAKQQQQQTPELQAISKAIGQYLDELSSTNARQMELLANSVNISFTLAKLTSQVEGLEDWNDKFKQVERMFTYFVPSDLAWLRLQQTQPELYKPLMYFLEQKQQQQVVDGGSSLLATTSEQQVENSLLFGGQEVRNKLPRSSESSHRLRQILERHLVVNKKIGKRELNLLDSLQTIGATLRLMDHPVTDTNDLAPAALHSIVSSSATGNGNSATFGLTSNNKLKTLRLDSVTANIVQVNEASNGYVYVIDNVLLLPSDPEYLLLTSASPAVSSSMSSLLGAHNSAILDFIHSLLAPAPFNLSAQSVLALLATLTLAIALLLVVALVLLVRRHRQNKLHRHQQLESGLTSSSSANSGSTSTTKSL